MAPYAAVEEATRLAYKETELLRRALKQKHEREVAAVSEPSVPFTSVRSDRRIIAVRVKGSPEQMVEFVARVLVKERGDDPDEMITLVGDSEFFPAWEEEIAMAESILSAIGLINEP